VKKNFSAQVGRWLAELLLVFIGVYAAFWLNDFQQAQQRARQRDQILASLERQLQEGVENTKAQAARATQERGEFQQALEGAGSGQSCVDSPLPPTTTQATSPPFSSPAGSSCSM
jgi:type II secretory pathway component PulJ